MSFILDALRKSEHERQRQSGPGIADLRPASARSGLPLWAVALGALLAINLIVAVVLILRGSASGPQTVNAAPNQAPVAPAAGPSAAPPTVTAALPRSTAPAPSPQYEAPMPTDEGEYADSEPMDESGLNEPQLAPKAQSNPAASGSPDDSLPSIFDPAIQSSGAVPELHLDIHVYAQKPADRFVFINNRK